MKLACAELYLLSALHTDRTLESWREAWTAAWGFGYQLASRAAVIWFTGETQKVEEGGGKA